MWLFQLPNPPKRLQIWFRVKGKEMDSDAGQTDQRQLVRAEQCLQLAQQTCPSRLGLQGWK